MSQPVKRKIKRGDTRFPLRKELISRSSLKERKGLRKKVVSAIGESGSHEVSLRKKVRASKRGELQKKTRKKRAARHRRGKGRKETGGLNSELSLTVKTLLQKKSKIRGNKPLKYDRQGGSGETITQTERERGEAFTRPPRIVVRGLKKEGTTARPGKRKNVLLNLPAAQTYRDEERREKRRFKAFRKCFKESRGKARREQGSIKSEKIPFFSRPGAFRKGSERLSVREKGRVYESRRQSKKHMELRKGKGGEIKRKKNTKVLRTNKSSKGGVTKGYKRDRRQGTCSNEQSAA